MYAYIYIYIYMENKLPGNGLPRICQLIEQENRDPNKALGQSVKITVYLEFAF